MSYTYTDHDGDELEIQPSVRAGHLLVCARRKNGGDSAVARLPHEEAPALALALLEEAGIKPDPWGGHLTRAMDALNSHERERAEVEAKRVEREAEEAAAMDWLKGTNAWVNPDHEVTESDVRAWKRNRDYFSKIHDEIVDAEIAEPRVLQHGDPEPDRTTWWRDDQGDVWFYRNDGWYYKLDAGVLSRAHSWDDLGTHVFPVTETTE